MKSRLPSKIVVCLVTGAAALACAYSVVNSLRQYHSAGPAAKEMRIEEAITLQSVADERPRWVRITSKMVPTCESIQESGSGSVTTTTHLALDETGKYGLFLEYQGDVGCPAAAQGPLEGLLKPASTAFWEHNGGSVPQTMLPLMNLEVGHTPRVFLETAGVVGVFGLLMAVLFVIVLRVPNQDPRQKRALGATAGTIG